MAKFVCQAGPHAGHEYPLGKDATVFGRQSSADVQILDGMASREHFRVRRVGRLFTIADLDSRNGTKVNGRKVSERQLEFGDRVRVGDVEYLFVKEEGDADIKDLLTAKYLIVEKIGEGGMGVVYKARQRSMDRIVALKTLAPKYSARPRFVETFIAEARAAGRLNHPNIIQVHDVDSENGIHYFSMEFIDGATCAEWLAERGPFPLGQALEITRLVAKALGYAHENHLIHRDVKPDNIMIGPAGTVKLADLGISKTFEEAEAEGRPKRIVGTPHYMAPEAAMGERIDHRIDIYSLGATLYHLLSGQTPFSAPSAADLLKAHVSEEPTPLASVVPQLPAAALALVQGMMIKQPQRRLPDMAAVVQAIEALQRETELGGERPGGETVLLRRLASGDPEATAQAALAAAVAKPTAGPVRVRTPAAAAAPIRVPPSTAAATRTRTRERSPRQDHPGVRWLLTIVVCILIVAVIGALSGTVISWLREEGLIPPKTRTGTLTGPETIPATGSDDPRPASGQGTTNRAIDAAAQAARQLAELDGLRNRLRPGLPLTTLDELRNGANRIEAEAADERIRGRARELVSAVVAAVEQQLETGEQRQLADLETEVQQLRQLRDYDGALRRLDGLATSAKPLVASRLADLRAGLTEERDAWLRDTGVRIDQLASRGDAVRLRRLRDELPEAQLDGALARRIDTALAEIDRGTAERQGQRLGDLRRSVVEWNYDEFERLAISARPEFTNSAAGEELAQLSATMSGLRAFTAAIDAAARSQARPPRYRGLLNGINEPDLVGATAQNLLLAVGDAGTISVPWRSMDTTTRQAVARLVLGDAAEAHQAALDAVAALAGRN